MKESKPKRYESQEEKDWKKDHPLPDDRLYKIFARLRK